MSKSYACVILSDSEVSFLEKRRMQAFVHLSIVFCLYSELHHRRSISSNFLIFQTFEGISSRRVSRQILENVLFISDIFHLDC